MRVPYTGGSPLLPVAAGCHRVPYTGGGAMFPDTSADTLDVGTVLLPFTGGGRIPFTGGGQKIPYSGG